jgi:WD40 repeat protein
MVGRWAFAETQRRVDQNKTIAQLEFRSDVRAVKLRRDSVTVVLDTQVQIYKLKNLELLECVETYSNPTGIIAVCPSPSNHLVAMLGTKIGEVVLLDYNSSKRPIKIPAHTNSVRQIAVNLQGNLLATCSDKGTLIRLYNTSDGTKVTELRRGTMTADIYNIAFGGPNSNWLCLSSASGTVHVFSLNSPQNAASENRASTFSFMSSILPVYFSSTWSCAQFTVPEPKFICAFGAESKTENNSKSDSSHSINVLCSNGKYYKYSFDPEKKEAQRIGFGNFVDMED